MEKKLGLSALTALVLSSMLGAANRLLFRMGILAVRGHRQRLLSGDRFFRVKLFYGHAGIAPVWRW